MTRKSIVMLLLFLFAARSHASSYEVDGLYYTLQDDGTAMIVAQGSDGDGGSIAIGFSNGYSGDIIVPDSVDIDGQLFAVSAVGDYAFLGATSLTSVSLPATISQIGATPFANSTKLTAINVADGNKDFCSVDGVLFDKECTTLIACPGAKSGDYSVPATVDSICSSAFYGCSTITAISLPSSVRKFGVNVFRGCSKLTSLEIPEGVSNVPANTFYGCRLLKNITLPCTLESIAHHAFYYCQSLANIQLPEGLISIDYNAFEECVSLDNVKLPNTLTDLGSMAFHNCTSLSDITIPASVSVIGESPFSGCTRMTTIDVDASNTDYCSIDGVLFDIDAKNLICCPSGKSGDYVMPSTVCVLGASAFFYCRKLTSVRMSLSIDTIGTSAFNGCKGLTSIEIPGNVKSIGKYAFSNCTNLTSMICHASIPPETFSNSYLSSTYAKPLYVPSRRVDTYKSASVWRSFKQILPIEEGMTVVPSTAYSGALACIDIAMKVAEIDVKSYTFDMELPDGISPAFYNEKPLFSFTDIYQGTPELSLQQLDDTTNSWRLTVTLGEECSLLEYEGDILRLYLKVASDVVASTYFGMLDNPTVILSDNYDSSMDNAEFDLVVESALLGDVNLDGRVSVSDVSTAISYLLGDYNGVFFWQLADLNMDGKISVADVSWIINIILN